MRDAVSPFIDRRRPEELSKIPESFNDQRESVPSFAERSVVRKHIDEPKSFNFAHSPEYRRESILVLLGQMAAHDGSAAVDALLHDASRYFRPAV